MADTDRNAMRAPSFSRWRARLVGLVLLVLAACAALAAGQWASTRIEGRLAARVRAELAAQSLDWVRIAADGLEVRLSGTAPDEIQKLRAVATASDAAAGITGLARVRDDIGVASAAQTAIPPFRLEILRNEQGTSVIGLAPRGMQRRAVIERLGRAAGPSRLTDLLELTDHPAPDHWDETVAFAVAAAEQMPRAKISVTPGRVEITAVTNGQAEKARLEQALSLSLPAGVALATNISAPRPVIAPFTLEITRDADGTRLNRCSADTTPSREAILAAAARAGVEGTPACEVGLGAPSPQWPAAAIAGIEALAALPAGRLTITDSQVVLDAPAQAQDGFAAARDRLAQALPRSFALTAMLAPPAPGDPAAGDAPLQLVVSTGPQGVRLRGTVPDERMGAALASLAAARLGPADSTGLAVRGDTPSGWAARGMAAIEALDVLDRGTATVTPALIAVQGTTGNPAAATEIARRLAARLGPGAAYELALGYDPRLDPATGLPSGQQCVDALNTAMQQAEIGFEPNRAALAGEVGPSIQALAAELEHCSDFRIEVGGHTDSQGSADFNHKLSADRARAVIAALAGAGADTTHLSAVGHGADRPVASNATPEGREANRRIEFRLLSPEPVTTEPPAQITTRGTTTASPAAPENGSGDAGTVVEPPGTAPGNIADTAADAADAADANTASRTEGADDTARPAVAQPSGTTPRMPAEMDPPPLEPAAPGEPDADGAAAGVATADPAAQAGPATDSPGQDRPEQNGDEATDSPPPAAETTSAASADAKDLKDAGQSVAGKPDVGGASTGGVDATGAETAPPLPVRPAARPSR